MSDQRPKETANITDVARAAGVSIATVSRFVNESGYVSTENRVRIEQVIRDLDFMPNASARSLNTRRSHVLGFVVSSIAHPYSAEVCRGIQDVATAAGFVVSICSTDARAELELAALRVLYGHRVDAVIATPPESDESDRYLERLASRGTVVVLIGRHLSHPLVDTVTTDTSGGASAAMAHLLDLGHRRIGYVGGKARRPGARLVAYRRALAESGIAYDERLALQVDISLDDSYRAVRELLRRPWRPTAVFCIDDLVALGALQAARDENLGVPDDLSIVGFDDDVYARLVRPPLTTVAQPSFEIGRTAAERALLRLGIRTDGAVSSGPAKEVIRLPCRLVLRESTGPARVPSDGPTRA